MGGPFRAIVGGQVSYRWTFPPAQGVRFNNYSVIYGHAIEIDEYIAPGQIGMVVPTDPPIVALTFKFEAPPGATQAAPVAGQVLQMTSYDAAPGGVEVPPLGPDVGLILPIGLDQPQHFHHFTGTHSHTSATHLHGHSATHAHTSATHAHAHSGTHVHAEGSHTHTLNIQAGAAIVTAVGLDAGGTLVAAAGPQPVGTVTDATNLGNTGATSPGNTDNATPGNTGASAPGNTDNATPGSGGAASPGDSDLENVQHTHP